MLAVSVAGLHAVGRRSEKFSGPLEHSMDFSFHFEWDEKTLEDEYMSKIISASDQ